MRKTCALLATALFQLLFAVASDSQETGYIDAFDGDMRVSGPPSFVFNQENGILEIAVDKESKTWQGVYYAIGGTIDITSFPFMNLMLKTTTPFLLTAYVVDADDNNATRSIKVYASGTHVTYCIDFSGATAVDLSRITALIFTPNGNTHDPLVADVLVDELRLGTAAEKLAGIGAVGDQLYFNSTTDHRIDILDLTMSGSLIVTAPEEVLSDVVVSGISNGMASISFDCRPGVTGWDTLTVTAVGAYGYSDNSIRIPFEIEGNLPPSMNAVSDREVMVGDTIEVLLTGLNDGNSSAEQPLAIFATSENQESLPDSNITIDYRTGETTARLSFVPVRAGSDIDITVTLDDRCAENSTYTATFSFTAYEEYNHPPTIDYIPDQFTYLSFGQGSIALSGISDGDSGDQKLQISAVSSADNVIPDSGIFVDFFQGSSTARLFYAPINTGATTITLTLQDDGGTDDNNGDVLTQIQFDIEVGTLPPTGYTVPMSGFDTTGASDRAENVGEWCIEGNGVSQICRFGTFHGKDDVIRIDLIDKSCWTGLWYHHPELNVDRHRYLCYDIYFEGGDFESNGSGLTHCYYWDDGWDSGVDRNLTAAHDQRKIVAVGKWQTVFMDFRGEGGMDNDVGEQIDVRRIQKILINYATSFGWPFPVDNGTVYITDIRLASDVPPDLVPAVIPRCTIDPVADFTLFPGAGSQTVELTGISDGAGNRTVPAVSARSGDVDFIPHPAVSDVDEQGRATLAFQPVDKIGKARITVTVSAEGSQDRSISFDVEVIEGDPAQAATIELAPDSLFQIIHGFGTFSFSGSQNYMDYYTDNLGASAMRIGLIGNQIEPVNDNNDPYVLDMDALNYSAFDFDYFRQLKESGVETFILTSWSPPGWMKRNLTISYAYASAPRYEDTDNVLEPYYYEEFAESMVAAIRMFENEAGIELAAIGPQNEPAFCEPYPSAVLGPRQFAELVAVIGKRFESEGLSTKIYTPEHVFYPTQYSMSQYIDAIRDNSEADEYADIIAVHHYASDGIGEVHPTYPEWTAMWDQSQRCHYPKEMWMTETYPGYVDWNSALTLAGAIHGSLVYGQVGFWALWDIEGTLMEQGKPTASFYTSKNFYKFIRPGARRIKAESDHNDILVSSFIHERDNTLTTVLINKSSGPLTVKFAGDSIPEFFDVYTTAEYVDFQYRGRFAALESIALPASSVTTLVGDTGGPLAAIGDMTNHPEKFHLYQNYPNPFNPITTIRFNVPIKSDVGVNIYNVLGQKVRTLIDRTVLPGEYEFTWDGRSDSGAPVASGIYIYRFTSDHFTAVKKCILIR